MSKPVEKIRIVLLGSYGSGKSRLGNNILGYKHFQIGPPTTSVEKMSGEVAGRKFVVVDTPAITTNDENPGFMINESIWNARPGPHVFLFCIKMDRFTNQALHMLKTCETYLGKAMYNYTIVVFTHSDQWKMDMEEQGCVNPSFESYISNLPEDMKFFLTCCSNRYCSFNNRETGDKMAKQCHTLFREIDLMIETNLNVPKGCSEQQSCYNANNANCKKCCSMGCCKQRSFFCIKPKHLQDKRAYYHEKTETCIFL